MQELGDLPPITAHYEENRGIGSIMVRTLCSFACFVPALKLFSSPFRSIKMAKQIVLKARSPAVSAQAEGFVTSTLASAHVSLAMAAAMAQAGQATEETADTRSRFHRWRLDNIEPSKPSNWLPSPRSYTQL